MEETQNKNGLLVFLLLVFSLEAILFSLGNVKLDFLAVEKERKIKDTQTILDGLPIIAKALSVYDATENLKIYGKNDEEALPLASLAKTMTVSVALVGRDNGEMIYLSGEAVKQVGDFGLLAGEKWKLGDLAKLTLIVSANDGAYALSGGTPSFLEKMNIKARKIGMEHTLFLNPTGLDILDKTTSLPVQAGAFASVADANIMALYALLSRPEIFSVTTQPELNLNSESGFSHNFKNTNIILDKIPNLLFSKTGFTELAGGNLTIIFLNKQGHKIAVTLMGSTFEERFSDMEKIVEVLYNAEYGSTFDELSIYNAN
ncbi:MAG: hypothetical protein Q8O46_05090 [bacterium]|nr:hypothetical protein [bacterium]